MLDHASSRGTPRDANLCAWGAAAAVAAGAVIYLAVRDQVPAITPAWLANNPTLDAVRATVPDFLTGPLPSFLHALAVLLLTAVFVRQSRLAAPAMLMATALCLVLEVIQYPPAAAGIAAIAGTRGMFGGLVLYAVNGTFDGLDVLGILLASAIVFLSTGGAVLQVPLSARST